ncbi:MAG: hypothetical protein ACM3ZQ_09475 [Bacillota bacterium]
MGGSPYRFRVSADHSICPQFGAGRIVDELRMSKRISLRITGVETSSLIAITAVVDYVQALLPADTELGWCFTPLWVARPNELDVVLTYDA